MDAKVEEPKYEMWFTAICYKEAVQIKIQLKVHVEGDTEYICIANETEDYKQSYKYSYDMKELLDRRRAAVKRIEDEFIKALEE